MIDSILNPRNALGKLEYSPLTRKISQILVDTELLPKGEPEKVISTVFASLNRDDLGEFLSGDRREYEVALISLLLGIQAIYQGENYGEWKVSNVDTLKLNDHQYMLLQIILMEVMERDGAVTHVSGYRYNPFSSGTDVIYNVPKET